MIAPLVNQFFGGLFEIMTIKIRLRIMMISRLHEFFGKENVQVHASIRIKDLYGLVYWKIAS